MTKQIEAMKLALEGAANYIDALGGDSRKYRQALAEQPAQQEPAPGYCKHCKQYTIEEPLTAQQVPVAYDKTELNCFAQDLYDQKMREGKRGHYESMFHVIHQCINKVASIPAQRKPLTDEGIDALVVQELGLDADADAMNEFARAIEAAHGIKENT